MVHLDKACNQLEILTKRYDRFSVNKILGPKDSIDEQTELMIKLRTLENDGLLELKWVVYCTECGADLVFFDESMSNNTKTCEYCQESSVVDPSDNVRLVVYLTEKGKLFFRSKGREN